MQNHRNFVRWQIHHKAKVRLDQAIDDVFCYVNDINYKGVGVILNAKLPEDTAFRMRLNLSDGFLIEAEVWVAWNRMVDGVNHYGLYFSKLKDADKEKIYRFINTHCQSEVVSKWWPGQNNAQDQDINAGQSNAGQIKENDQALDARIFERFAKQIPMRFINLDDGTEYLGQTVDISAKGLGLSTNQQLRPHAALEIWLDLSNSQEPLYTRGEVAWSKPEIGGSYRAGVALDKADFMNISRLLRE
jgi:hypothetical protein